MDTLSTSQVLTKDLEQQESIIERGLKSYIEAGVALEIIKKEKLYKGRYGTYKEYCQKRWGFTPQYVNQLIRAADLIGTMKSETIVSLLPEKEAQARALSKSNNPTEVWRDTQIETGKDQPTAKEIAMQIEKLDESKIIEAKIVQADEDQNAIDANPLPDEILAIMNAPYDRGMRTGRAQVCVESDDKTFAILGDMKQKLGISKEAVVAKSIRVYERLYVLKAQSEGAENAKV